MYPFVQIVPTPLVRKREVTVVIIDDDDDEQMMSQVCVL